MKTELLAPAKNIEIAITAIDAGADAVYIGASGFGARHRAGNSLEDIEKLVNYAHKFYVKVMVTVNTIIKNSELEDVKTLIKKLYEIGVDSIIVQDMAILKWAIEGEIPPIPLHISTQCNNRTEEKVNFFNRLGIPRVVLARELSIYQIKNIIEKNPNIEIETFIHGALCVSYSGQCYMSNYLGGRSANRGECAQPCRKKYSVVNEDGKVYIKDKHVLSLKDFNASDKIKDLIKIGVKSFKIEGRMKNEYYVASAVDAYRELVNDYLNGSFFDKKAAEYKKRLANIYNRGGFCDGYFFMHNGPSMISKHRPNNQGVLIGHLKDVKDGKILIDLKAQLYKGDVLEINLRNNKIIEITSGQEKNAHSNVWLNAPKTKLILKGQDVYRTRCSHLLDEVSKLEDKSKIGLNGRFTARVGKPLKLDISMAKQHIWGLDDNLVAFADNDVSKAGKRFSFNGREIPIISPHEIVKYDSGNLFLLITSIHYQQIYEELDGLLKNSCVPVISLDEIADAELENTSYSEPMRESNNQAIPKIIHYSWFGEEKPISIKKNIAKWKKLCPDFEFIEWNEKNYDVTKNKYMYQAYQKKIWGFVPDYLRLDVFL